MSTTTREGQAMDKLDAWLAAMPVDDVRERVAQLERELARLRLLLADAPNPAPTPAKVTAPVPRQKQAAGQTRTRRMSPQRWAIVEIVREYPDGVAPVDVARRLGKLGGTVQAAMWRMGNDDQLVNVGGLYKLPPTIPTDEERQARRKELADTQSLPFPEGSEGEAMDP